MINATMKTYDYFTFGADNDYGQPQLSEQPTGKIKIAINVTSQSVIDNIRFKDATYLGLTHAAIDDSTGQVLAAYFDNQETLNGYYNIYHQILTKYRYSISF